MAFLTANWNSIDKLDPKVLQIKVFNTLLNLTYFKLPEIYFYLYIVSFSSTALLVLSKWNPTGGTVRVKLSFSSKYNNVITMLIVT